ncbi:DsbA family protein [Litoreibacter arenae]|uniref:Periplasmic thiol:disulfide interchange protein DsbA n=1 Tax=Litoreibacter arenae DSM 19593 TaxID=1123360 RepID=S9QDV6_9RHOB|nr:DsbA family protein [Litoreibacter arenae]EPX77788.1 Periplasmic thiol:disulfide interchange protein DsbA [Litoreibacter arenae DSM 19593]
MKRNILIAIVGVLAIGLGAFVLTGNAPEPVTPVNAQTSDSAEVDTSSVKEMTLGEEDAPVTLVEYASFTCPHCATFHTNVFPKLKKDYIDTGKVKFVFREVYFDRYGLWAGMVARCGGGMRYFGIVDLIFDNQREWAQGEPAQIAGNLRKFGKQAGLDDETLDACLTDGEKAAAMAAVYQKNADADGISSTPSLVINGTTHPNMSYDDLKELIDAEL